MIKISDEMQQLLPQLVALTNTRRYFLRAHYVLPRHRRRRYMSYNFRRLPYSLRPRALRETGSDSLIYKLNAPKPSRKAIRCHTKNRTHIFLAKRMHMLSLRLGRMVEGADGVYKLTAACTQKMLRFALRERLAVVDRSESLYSVVCPVYRLELTDGFQVVYNIPVEVINTSSAQYLILYSFYLSRLRSSMYFSTSNLKSVLVFGDLSNFLQKFSVKPFRAQQCPKFSQMTKENTNPTTGPRDFTHLMQADMTGKLDQMVLQKLAGICLKKKAHERYERNLTVIDEETQQTEGEQLVIYKRFFGASILMPNEELLGFFRLQRAVCGAKEKRYLCFKHQTVDMLQWLGEDQIESMVAKRKKIQQHKNKDPTLADEFKHFLMTTQSIAEVKFYKKEFEIVEKPEIGLYKFIQLGFANGDGLYVEGVGKIGLKEGGQPPSDWVL